jgi:hypothetical protein
MSALSEYKNHCTPVVFQQSHDVRYKIGLVLGQIFSKKQVNCIDLKAYKQNIREMVSTCTLAS